MFRITQDERLPGGHVIVWGCEYCGEGGSATGSVRAAEKAWRQAESEGCGCVLRCTGQEYDRAFRPTGEACTAVLFPFPTETPEQTITRARAAGWAVGPQPAPGGPRPVMCPYCRAPEGRPGPATRRREARV